MFIEGLAASLSEKSHYIFRRWIYRVELFTQLSVHKVRIDSEHS